MAEITLLAELLQNSQDLDIAVKEKYYKEYNGRTVLFISKKNVQSLFPNGELELIGFDIQIPIVLNSINQEEGDRYLISDITINNCINIDLEISGNSKIGGINIHNSTNFSLKILDTEIGIGGIIIDSKKTLKNDVKENNRIICENIICNSPFFVHDVIKIETIEITNSAFRLNANYHIKANQSNNIRIQDVATEKLLIHNSELHEGISLVNVDIKGIVKITGGTNHKHVNKIGFINSPVLGQIELYDLECSNIYFSVCRNIESLVIGNISFRQLANSQLNHIQHLNLPPFIKYKMGFDRLPSSGFLLTASSCNDLNISNISDCELLAFIQCSIVSGYVYASKTVDKILFKKQLSSTTTLLLDTIKCHELAFDDFTNVGSLYLKSVGSTLSADTNLLKILNSDLGKTHFINCEFEDSWEYHFENSNILGINIVASKFPKKNAKGNLLQDRILFSQLYKIYESSGSRVRAILYQKLGLESYHKYLGERIAFRKEKRRLRIASNMQPEPIDWKERWDYIALSLHKLSSDFDYKLNRAILNLIASSVFLYLLYILLLNHYSISFKTIDDIRRFGNLIANYFVFLSPIHRTSFINQYPSGDVIIATPSAAIVDGISKIIISYLIYQMVQAFRKFGKRSV